MSTIYDRIRETRISRGMTQEELAIACGYACRSTMGKIEQGQRRITVDLLKKLATALNVDADWLAMGDDTEKKDEILQLFNRLNDEQQDNVLAFLRSMLGARAGDP